MTVDEGVRSKEVYFIGNVDLETILEGHDRDILVANAV